MEEDDSKESKGTLRPMQISQVSQVKSDSIGEQH